MEHLIAGTDAMEVSLIQNAVSFIQGIIYSVHMMYSIGLDWRIHFGNMVVGTLKPL